MVELLAVLSRYYFVFLMICFIIVGYGFLRGYGGRLRTQKAIIALFALFAFAIVVDTWSGALFALAVIGFGIIGSFLLGRFYRNLCPLMTNIVMFKLTLGFIMLWRLDSDLALRQLVFAALALGLSLFIPLLFKLFKNFEKLEKLYFIICAGLLLLVMAAAWLADFTNIPLVAIDQFGSARWINIAGVTFQPSEFAVLAFLLFLACVFREKPSFGKLVFASVAVAGLVLILVLQRNLGGALMFFMVYMIMMYAATGSKILFLGGFGAMSIASVLAYQIFPHIRVRVAAFLDPWGDIAGGGFQLSQSIFAVSTWGAFGSGLGRGLPERIPVVERDVIFSAISEEFGWIFGLLLLALYVLFLLRGLQLARRVARPLYAMMALGFTTFLTFQAFVSIAGNIRFMPMTGVTLPFISYGGTSVFVCILMLAVLNWLSSQLDENPYISRQYEEELDKMPEESL